MKIKSWYFFLISIIIIVLASGFYIGSSIDGKMDENIIVLNITQKDWTGWSKKQPEPKTEIKKVKKGDKITLSRGSAAEAQIFIEKIEEKSIYVHFRCKGVVKPNANGTTNLLSKDWDWTDSIKYNQDYEVTTQTMDEGTTWVLNFKK